MKITITAKHKSIPSGTEFELPEMCVLTGKNGSGKSHLLEVMADPRLSKIVDKGSDIQIRKYIPFNGLSPIIDEQCDHNTVINHARNLWTPILNALNSFGRDPNTNRRPGHEQTFEQHLFGRHMTDEKQRSAIRKIAERLNLSVEKLTEDLIRQHFNASEISSDEMFASNFATIFKTYHVRSEENKFAHFKHLNYGENTKWISNEDFINKYGPPPWELVNSILENAKLPYIVSSPEGQTMESIFRLVLKDTSKNLEISVNDLSTGEKVLMSLALAIYNSGNKGSKLDLLLLDEPDAALHPEFSELLIDSIDKFIVKGSGVRVVVTTHSATTVASTQGISLYEMNKKERKPERIATSDAIALLTGGIVGLKVSNERRRQVFVESVYDVGYYESIHSILVRACGQFDFNPTFIPPHSRPGSNCDDVIKIVKELSSNGNDLVWGVVDFDGSRLGSGRVLVIGAGSRYSIESYILDPLFIGALLVREQLLNPTLFGAPEIVTYIDFQNAKSEALQKVIDYICGTLDFKKINPKICKTSGGFDLQIPEEYLLFPGHDMETKILAAWPGLNGIKRGRSADNILKDYIIKHIFNDFPQLISVDFQNLFKLIS